jgi:hypothetical protein
VLASAGQARRLDDRGQLAAHVFARRLEAVEQPDAHERDRHQRVRRPPPVGHVQLAAGPQHPPHLDERLQFLATREVVEEQARDDGVERRVLVGELLRHRLVEAHARRLHARPLEHLGVTVDPHDLGCRLALGDRPRQRAGAACQVEDALTRPRVELVEQPRLEGALAGGRSHHRVVEAREAAQPQRGDVARAGLAHERALSQTRTWTRAGRVGALSDRKSRTGASCAQTGHDSGSGGSSGTGPGATGASHAGHASVPTAMIWPRESSWISRGPAGCSIGSGRSGSAPSIPRVRPMRRV